MPQNENRESVSCLLGEEFRRERSSGFAMLRRTPSTHVRKFLDYFAALDEGSQDALADGLTESALSCVVPNAPHPYKAGNAAFRRYVDAMPSMWDWRYEGPRELRMMLAVAKLEPESRFGRAMNDSIRKWIETIQPVKSTEIRKLVKLALSQLMNPLTTTHKGQYWEYEGSVNGQSVCITIDYSNRYHQLDYWVSLGDHKRSHSGLNYERLMGLSFAHWDCIEQANLDPSIALLKESIVHCVAVLQHVRDL